MKIFIYKLIDPITNKPRYIGKTGNISNRFSNHLYSSKSKNTYVYKWIKSLLKKNLIPLIEIIEECSINNWEEREIYWINYYRNKYDNLCNYQKGGGNYNGPRNKNVTKYDFNQGKYRVRCSYNNTTYYVGLFETPEEAMQAYDSFYENPLKSIKEINKRLNMPKNYFQFKSVEVFDKQGNYLCSFDSVAACAKHYNIFATNIAACCRGVSKSYKGMVFKYKKEE